MIRAIVLDFDGVIANSEPLHLRAFQDVLSETGIPLSEREYYARYLGFDDVGMFQAVMADRHRRLSDADLATLVARKAARLEALERERPLLFPGAAGAVRRLARDFPLAIASGALGHEIRRALDQERLADCFAAIVAAEDTPVSKPAPDPYALAVRRLQEAVDAGLRPDECAAVEDSRWGLESAREAGLHTIAVTHSYPASALTAAEAVIPSLADLTEAVLLRFGSSQARASISSDTV